MNVAAPVAPPLVTNLRNTCPSKIVDLTKALSMTTAGSTYTYRICECVTSNIVIRPDSYQRIEENGSRFVEGDSVLRLIGGCFHRIPLE